MDEYTFITKCGHEGTIKPVKSSGNYAGKWICRVKGPKVNSQGVDVKTLYTAPFIGAAKASIAKFLCVTVNTVVVTALASEAKLMSTPTSQLKAASKGSDEFDDGDDDAFASFDLNAAVASATKLSQSPYAKPSNPYSTKPNKNYERKGGQALPPQYPISNCKSSIPKSPTKQSPYLKPRSLYNNQSNEDRGKKGGQELPPQYPNYKSSTPDATQSKAHGDLRKEMEGLRAEKDLLNQELGTAKQETLQIRQVNDRTKKETEDAKCERDCLKEQIDGMRKEHDKLLCEMKSMKAQNDKAKKDTQESEVRELNEEKSKLKGQIRALQEQRDELQSAIKSTTQESNNIVKQNHEKELKEFGAEKNKLKGQIRALQEQYDQLNSQIKTATQTKDVAEKEAQAALAKKEAFEKEAMAAKKTLDSQKSALESSSKKQAAQKVTGLSESSEPPTKKQKTAKQAKVGTIVKSMKVSELKEEAVARGVDMKTLAKVNKDQLLDLLVVGSPCIIKTDAWDEILRLRKSFADERHKAEQLEMQRQEEVFRREEQKRKEKEEKERQQREIQRAEEVSKQGELHSLSIPKVHGCKLAKTNDLLFYGSSRSYKAGCTECHGRWGIEYTCEKCNYDICNECFKEKTMTPAEKKAEAKRKAAAEKERQKMEAEMRRLQEEEDEKHRKKWDPKTHFSAKIIDPPKKNKDPDGNKLIGFTIWCSDGYGNDGWHSYEGPPDKHFDTTYATKKEANARARYLFHWKNPWGHRPEEIENEEIHKSTKDGMDTYTVTPDDSTTWTVSVVPDAAFAYLDNAIKQRRYDCESEEGDSGDYYSSCLGIGF